MALKKAATTTTRKDLGDGDWIEVRDEITKREYKALVKYFPEREVDAKTKLTAAEGLALTNGLFEALVVAWSADMPCTVEEYEGLDAADSQRIDEVLTKHFATLMPSADEGKAATTSRGSRR